MEKEKKVFYIVIIIIITNIFGAYTYNKYYENDKISELQEKIQNLETENKNLKGE